MATTKATTKRTIAELRAGVDRSNFVRLGDLNDLQIENLTIGNTLVAAPGSAGLTVTSDLASPTAIMDLVSNLATRADGDTSRIRWYFDNDAGASTEYARMDVVATDVTSGSENAEFQFSVMDQGTMREVFQISSSAAGAETVDFQGATDINIADGSITVVDADNATSLSVTNNTVTTADALVDVSSTSTTTGAMARINANAVTHDGEILELISAGDATATPTGMSITIPDVTTGAARGIDIVMAGATTTANGLRITMDAATTTDMVYLDNGGGTLTGDGKFIHCNDDDTTLFGVAGDGAVTIAGTASGTDALTLNAGDITASSGDITASGALVGSSVDVNGGAADADAIDIDGVGILTAAAIDANSSVRTSGTIIDIDSDTATLDANTTGIDLTIAQNHDGAAADSLYGINSVWSGNMTGGGAALDVVRANYTGTISDGAGIVRGLSATMSGYTHTNGTVHGLDIEMGGAVAAGTQRAARFLLGASTVGLFIDADSFDHTAGNIIDIDLGVNSASVNAINLNIDIGTLLSAAEVVRGTYMDINEAVVNADTSQIIGSEYQMTSFATSVNDLIGLEVNYDGTKSAAADVWGVHVNSDSLTLNDASATYAGVFVDASGMTNTSSSTAYGGHFLVGSTADAAVLTSDGTQVLSLSNGTSHLSSTTALITDMPVPTVGTGFDGAAVARWVPFGQHGVSGMFVTEFVCDLTDLVNSTTADDIIGESATANCHMGQITAAIHGSVFAIEIMCLETPAGGDPDIDLYSATESTGTENALVTDLTETLLHAHGASWAVGEVSATSAVPAANEYLYLAVGSAGGAPGTYTAGKFRIRIYGT